MYSNLYYQYAETEVKGSLIEKESKKPRFPCLHLSPWCGCYSYWHPQVIPFLIVESITLRNRRVLDMNSSRLKEEILPLAFSACFACGPHSQAYTNSFDTPSGVHLSKKWAEWIWQQGLPDVSVLFGFQEGTWWASDSHASREHKGIYGGSLCSNLFWNKCVHTYRCPHSVLVFPQVWIHSFVRGLLGMERWAKAVTKCSVKLGNQMTK